MTNKMAFKSSSGKKEVLRYYDMLLEKLSVPYEKLNINTRYGDAFIIAAGKADAPPLILLHGSSMNLTMWIGDIHKYQQKYRVYAPDLPGQPGRSDERQLPFTTTDHSEWLLDVFKGLALEKAVLIGASLGAWLATKFSINYPQMVEKLILLCPAGIGSQNKSFLYIAMFHMLMGKKGIERLMQKINGNQPIPIFIRDYQKLIAENFNNRNEPIPLFSDNELKKLTMPSLLLVGGKDIMLRSYETAERYKKLVPHASVVVLPEAGHSLTEVSSDIMSFLEN